MYYDLTGCDPAQLIRAAYDLSEAKGVGKVYYKAGPLPQEELEAFLRYWKGSPRIFVMTMVLGRSVDLVVLHQEDRLITSTYWPGHTEWQIKQLVKRAMPAQPLTIRGSNEAGKLEE